MILEPDHLHKQQPKKSNRRRKKAEQFNADFEIRKTFEQILVRSEAKLNQHTISNINKLRQLRQKRIYTGIIDSPLQYLFVVFQSRRAKDGLENQKLEHIIERKNKSVARELRIDELEIGNRPKSINEIKKQLADSINNLKGSRFQGSISSQSFQQQDRYNQKPQNYYEFRRNSYWKTPNQKTQEVQQFIKNMKQKQRQIHKKVKNKQKITKEKEKMSKQKIQENKKEELLKLKQQLHEQFQKKKQQKLKFNQQNNKKLEQVSQFLKKFKQKPPNYIIYSDRYRKKEIQEDKQKQQFLKQLKQAKRHSSLSQIRQQMRKYQQIKQAHQAERSQQRRMQEQLQQQIKFKLDSLYKSKLHSRSLNQKHQKIDLKAQKQQQMIKMLMYSKKAQKQHSPQIDEEKRFELLKDINELRKKEDHSKVIKIRNGQQIIINKSNLNPRQLGLQYLQELKQMTSQVQRKLPPTPPIKQKKLIDRSLLKTSFFNRKITISNWKQILQNKNLSQKEKQENLQVFFQMVQEKNLQNKKQLKNADPKRAIQLRNMIDHYEIEKTAAKLAMLKNIK